MPKLVAFDLDSTLTESKQTMTPEMGALLSRLLAKVPVAVMSGGAWHQFEKQLLPALPPGTNLANLYLFPTSAGQCRTYRDGTWVNLYDESFSDEERGEVTAALTEAMAETGFTAPPEKVWGERIEDRGPQVTFSALGQEAPPEEKKAWDPTGEKRRPLHEALAKRLPHFTVAQNATTSIDITKPGITKAYGVRKLAELTGIPVSEMLYVGDGLFPGGNDMVVAETGVPMHRVSGPQDSAEIIEKLLTSGD